MVLPFYYRYQRVSLRVVYRVSSPSLGGVAYGHVAKYWLLIGLGLKANFLNYYPAHGYIVGQE